MLHSSRPNHPRHLSVQALLLDFVDVAALVRVQLLVPALVAVRVRARERAT